MKLIKIIKTERDYLSALSRLEKIFDTKNDSTANEAELLIILIQDYERKIFSIAAPTPIDAIKFRMEQLNLKQAALVKYLGSRSRVSEILNGKRLLTLKMIAALHIGLSIPLESLILNEPKNITNKTSAKRSTIAREKRVGFSKKKK